jgi:hypothetical protein
MKKSESLLAADTMPLGETFEISIDSIQVEGSFMLSLLLGVDKVDCETVS